jgi:hypothetical protein
VTEQRITTKARLLQDIEQSWSELNAALDRLTERQLTEIRDAQGWSVKDHIIHMTAWERSMLSFFQGRPRYEGLGVSGDVYLTGDDDRINAEVYRQTRDMPLNQALRQFREVHNQLLALLQPLSDADLHRPYSHYLPHEPGRGDGPPAINVVYGNTAQHFKEHLGWINALVEGQDDGKDGKDDPNA